MKLDQFYQEFGEELELQLIAGKKGLENELTLAEAEIPGLSLAGYRKALTQQRVLVFGPPELAYLKEFPPRELEKRLQLLLKRKVPALCVAEGLLPPKQVTEICEKRGIPLFQSQLSSLSLLGKLLSLLADIFAPTVCCHGSFVEVFGMGLLIQGDSAVGKSEAALGLIERGHRLISDDIVRVRKLDDQSLEGGGSDLTRHHLEVRGVGIINVASHYGAASITEKKSLDIVVKLEVWDDSHFYDRAGLEEKTVTILATEVPYHILPVKPGRDVVLLVETIALNHRLKTAGFHAARELDQHLLARIEHKHRQSWIKNT